MAFCERCGLDTARLGSAGETAFRTCPGCASSCCANCWNQVAGGCLSCRPFSLPGAAPARPRWVGAALVGGAETQPPTDPVPSPAVAPARPTPRLSRNRADRPVPVAPTPVWPADAADARTLQPEPEPLARAGRRRGSRPVMGLMTLAAVVVVALVGFRVLGAGTGRPVAAEVALPADPTPSQSATAPSSEPSLGTSLPSSSPTVAVIPVEDPSEPPSERPSHYRPVSSGRTSSSGGGGGSSGGSGGGSATPSPTGAPTATETPGATPEPTATESPTPEPTESPTSEPTESPTPEPTASPEPTPEPTSTPEPTPTPTESPAP